MTQILISTLRTLNQLLTAGIAITAFSLLMYALSFNLRDKVARTFALILFCVVIVSVGDAISSISDTNLGREFWLRLEWVGITFLPAVYLHFSDALLTTTGRPSRGRRRLAVRLSYVISTAFLITLPVALLVGPLVKDIQPAPHLRRTSLTLIFTIYYLILMALAGMNFVRAYRRTLASASRRRMSYLIIGSLAPALGSFPYLLFGSNFAEHHVITFWLAAVISNLAVAVLLVMMAYAVAFFGVPWPDRLVKRRLAKWLMRGPVTASTVLAATTLVRRAGERFGFTYTAAVPITMVASTLLFEHLITLAAPWWERWLFQGRDSQDLEVVQELEERLLTADDLHQFLEALLAAVCDRIQSSTAFIAALAPTGLETLVTIGNIERLEKEDLSEKILAKIADLEESSNLFTWGEYWLVPLFSKREPKSELLGLLGIFRNGSLEMEEDQKEALDILAGRAALALEDRLVQSQVFASIAAINPEMEAFHTIRAATLFRGQTLLLSQADEKSDSMLKWVKDGLTHYWGGPKLTQNPLMHFKIVEQAANEHEDNPTNALRAILRQALDQIKPEGERRFTGEWILYNILELKFIEGRSVREVAKRLAMSEADLYRKQRVAIEAVAKAILEMEEKVSDYSTVDNDNHNQRGGV